jgi:hypothetical protein
MNCALDVDASDVTLMVAEFVASTYSRPPADIWAPLATVLETVPETVPTTTAAASGEPPAIARIADAAITGSSASCEAVAVISTFLLPVMLAWLLIATVADELAAT